MEYLETDIWVTPAEAIVIPVNTVGVMGKGLALQCKQKYPSVFAIYQSLCQQDLIRIGESCVIGTAEKALILCPTKAHFKNPSVFGYIRKGVESIIVNNVFWKFESIAFPKLGCGEGQLAWEQYNEGVLYGYCIKSLFESTLKELNCSVYIHV